MSSLEIQPERIQEDLRGLIAGDVLGGDVFRQLFASDGSIYEIRPLAVLRPRSVADVVACVQYAAEKELPLHARGAGSGVAGGSLGPGLVVDFSAYMRRVIQIDDQQVRVQAGMALERLNSQLAQHDRRLPLDPANSSVTTIGGMLGVDASGSRWPRFGSARRYVRRLQVVLADGRLVELGREPLHQRGGAQPASRKDELIRRLGRLLADAAETIAHSRPSGVLRLGGYNVFDVLEDDHLHAARLMVGSEGTLGLITEATLTTTPLPRRRGTMLLLFDTLESAVRAALEVVGAGPTACDVVDRRYVSLARETDPRFDLLIPAATEAVVLVEQEGENLAEVRRWFQDVLGRLERRHGSAPDVRETFDEQECELFWQLARKAHPALYPVKGPRRPVPVVEDIAVPPECLPGFVIRVQNVLKRLQVTGSLLIHAGQGEIHIEPFLDLWQAEDVARMRRLADELYREVFDAGGVIGGEHALGLSRTQYVRREAAPLYEVFEAIKAVFDPQGILNPGKIVDGTGDPLARYLRPQPVGTGNTRAANRSTQRAELSGEHAHQEQEEPAALRDLVELQLDWDPDEVAHLAAVCTRCGECRTQQAGFRMCPLFRGNPCEEASPRAKANLITGLLSGQVPLSQVTSDEFKQVVDLCVHCQMCRLECPLQVDIPQLMREAKGAYVTAHGLPVADWLATRLELLGALGSLVRPATNWAIGNRMMRWLMEKTLGIAQGRKLPRVAKRSFLHRAARRRLTRPTRHGPPKVAYFVDVYANYFDPALGEALVAVLEHNGVAVYVPPQQRGAGMSAIACGALDRARQLARRNVRVLAEAVRQGYHIVATEPAAALCLKREYPQLIDEDDARLVAEHTSEACEYLWRLHTSGRLQLDFKPLNAALVYHMPCHLKALEVGTPGLNLLCLVPGLHVRHVEAGCSGMAGTFGLLRKNFRASLRAGRRLMALFRHAEYQAGTTECSACKMQMEQGTTKPTIHPIKLLALAYGVVPELAGLLNRPGEELYVT